MDGGYCATFFGKSICAKGCCGSSFCRTKYSSQRKDSKPSSQCCACVTVVSHRPQRMQHENDTFVVQQEVSVFPLLLPPPPPAVRAVWIMSEGGGERVVLSRVGKSCGQHTLSPQASSPGTNGGTHTHTDSNLLRIPTDGRFWPKRLAPLIPTVPGASWPTSLPCLTPVTMVIRYWGPSSANI